MSDALNPLLESPRSDDNPNPNPEWIIRLADRDDDERADKVENGDALAVRQPEDAGARSHPDATLPLGPCHPACGERWAMMVVFPAQKNTSDVPLKTMLRNISRCTPSSANRPWHLHAASRRWVS